MPFDSVRNYYETLVFEEVKRQSGKLRDDSVLSDIACVALNHLPPRYFRHEVDFFFYLSPEERNETLHKVQTAVANAIEFIKNARK
ncbi:MAG: late competence development ComFB family protein [Gammaproteobacteria bacterium]|nr:late competence development ComFB family protein [Gammaproteobacteria bacterium]